MSGINIFTKKPRPLTKPDMGGETDCEDQGFTLIKDGCFVCPPLSWDKKGKPVRRKFTTITRYGHRYWHCDGCGYDYGEVRADG